MVDKVSKLLSGDARIWFTNKKTGQAFSGSIKYYSKSKGVHVVNLQPPKGGNFNSLDWTGMVLHHATFYTELHGIPQSVPMAYDIILKKPLLVAPPGMKKVPKGNVPRQFR